MVSASSAAMFGATAIMRWSSIKTSPFGKSPTAGSILTIAAPLISLRRMFAPSFPRAVPRRPPRDN